MKRLALVSILLFSGLAHGEGLPVDEKGVVTAPHTLIHLTSSQKEEMQTLGTVTLSDVQWADLRKVSPATPKRLNGILPYDYNDCTCGETVDGILLKDGSIAVLRQELDAVALRYQLDETAKLELRIDARGQFLMNGVLIRFPVLLEAIKASAVKKPDAHIQSFVAWISQPPGMKYDDPVLLERLRTIHRELAAKGWNDGRVPDLFR